MSDTTTATEETPTEEVETPAEETTTTEEQSAEEPKAEEVEEPKEEEAKEESKLSHEDALKALTKVRGENANWRTKYRDLEAKLEGAKTPEEIEAIKAEVTKDLSDSNHALVVENVALKHRLPDDLTAVLNAASAGKSREELEAHAKALAKYVPQAGDDEERELSGGLDPSDSDEFDPVKASREARSRGRSGGTATYR